MTPLVCESLHIGQPHTSKVPISMDQGSTYVRLLPANSEAVLLNIVVGRVGALGAHAGVGGPLAGLAPALRAHGLVALIAKVAAIDLGSTVVGPDGHDARAIRRLEGAVFDGLHIAGIAEGSSEGLACASCMQPAPPPPAPPPNSCAAVAPRRPCCWRPMATWAPAPLRHRPKLVGGARRQLRHQDEADPELRHRALVQRELVKGERPHVLRVQGAQRRPQVHPC